MTTIELKFLLIGDAEKEHLEADLMQAMESPSFGKRLKKIMLTNEVFHLPCVSKK